MGTTSELRDQTLAMGAKNNSIQSPTVYIMVILITLAMFALSPRTNGFQIVFDYSLDSTGFFSGENESRRKVLESAALSLTSRLKGSLPAIVPSGDNHWTLSIPRPDTGETITFSDVTVPANEVRIYVGARSLPSPYISMSDYQLTWFGDASWYNAFYDRVLCVNNFDSVGGAIAFEINEDWYFDQNPQTIEDMGFRHDFFSDAVHEIGRLLGFNSGVNAFTARTEGTLFVGTAARRLFGDDVPIAGGQYFPDDLTWVGQQVAMAFDLEPNTRRYFTDLDFAVLEDIGYKDTVADCRFRITQSGTQIKVTWPAFPRGFSLESADIALFPYQWGPVNMKPSISYDVNSLKLPTTDRGRIFRLISP